VTYSDSTALFGASTSSVVAQTVNAGPIANTIVSLTAVVVQQPPSREVGAPRRAIDFSRLAQEAAAGRTAVHVASLARLLQTRTPAGLDVAALDRFFETL
jgi:hypothetical protein